MKFKQLTSILALSAMMLSNSWALRGGPWDHLQELGGIRSSVGLYEGTIMMEDGSGIFRFTVQPFQTDLSEPIPTTPRDPLEDLIGLQDDNISNRIVSERLNAQLSNTMIFVRGQIYFGNTYGTVDIPARKVVGGSSGQSTVTSDLVASLGLFAEITTAVIDVGGFSESYSLSFDAKIYSTAPQIRFSGDGELSLFSRPPVEVSSTGIPGVNIIRNAPPLDSTISNNSVDSNSTVTTTTNTTTPILGPGGVVIGNQVTSTSTVSTSSNSTSSGADNTRPNAPLEPDLTSRITIMGARVSLFGTDPNEPVEE